MGLIKNLSFEYYCIGFYTQNQDIFLYLQNLNHNLQLKMARLSKVDRRKRIVPPNLYNFPYNCIGYIKSREKDFHDDEDSDSEIMFGTGFLISNCLVITSANQFLVKKQNGKLSQRIPLCFGIQQQNNEEDNITKQYKIQIIKINPKYIQFMEDQIAYLEARLKQWQKQQNKKSTIIKPDPVLDQAISQNDYCLLKLSKRIKRQKYFSLYPNLTNYFAKPNLTISGYEENQLFTHTNSISDIKKGTISYKIDTAGGQGGSPVCIANKDNKVVAIHKGYLHDQKVNFATMITDETISSLKKWCFELSCPFSDIKISQNNNNEQKQQDITTGVNIKITNIYPQNSIGRIISKVRQNKEIIGSGFLIANRFVLTSAAIVYPSILKDQIQSLSFLLFGSNRFIQIIDYRINLQFQKIHKRIQILRKEKQKEKNVSEKKKKQIQINNMLKESSKYDICLFLIEQDITKRKYFKLFPNFDISQDLKLQVSGHSNKYDWEDMPFTNSGKIKDAIDEIIYYDNDAVEGQIGAPVYFQDYRGYCSIGIHKGFSNEDNLSYGTIITSEHISLLNEWCYQMTPQFNVVDSQDY